VEQCPVACVDFRERNKKQETRKKRNLKNRCLSKLQIVFDVIIGNCIECVCLLYKLFYFKKKELKESLSK
jgi:hypothetical protein